MVDRGATPPRELIHIDGSDRSPANYSPAVRVGSHVYVSGMIAMRDGDVIGVGDVAAQTHAVLENIEAALSAAGAVLADVVRYRIYLTHIDDLAAARSALAPAFGKIRPAGTLVAVNALIHPDLKIEIDVDAVIGSALVEKGSVSP
jgi:enamine deaminase RidA (YjgF/YER057c/UK114 family)